MRSERFFLRRKIWGWDILHVFPIPKSERLGKKIRYHTWVGCDIFLKNQPARRVQADCGYYGELTFLDCFHGAVLGAGAAVDAQIGIDDVLIFALGDSLNGAVVNTGAALYASVIDDISHVIPSNCMYWRARRGIASLF